MEGGHVTHQAIGHDQERAIRPCVKQVRAIQNKLQLQLTSDCLHRGHRGSQNAGHARDFSLMSS